MKKKTVNSKELYKDFNRTLEAYKALKPDKYTSLEMICYSDLMLEVLIPRVKKEKPDWNDDDILQVAHQLWIGSIQSDFIDKYCQEV
jgi:hypothetical protein